MRAIKDDKILLDTAIKWELPVYSVLPRTATAPKPRLALAPTGTPATSTAPYNATTGVPGLRFFDDAAHQPREPITHATDNGVIYYTFDTDQSDPTNQPFSDAAKTAARGVMTQIMQLTNLRFKEVSGSFSGPAVPLIRLQFKDMKLPNIGSAAVGGEHAWVSSRYLTSTFAPGNVEVEDLFHEIGHTLGLNHPQVGDVGRFAEYPLDVGTLMVAEFNPDHDPSTYMPYDVAELQHVYGVNQDYNARKDVYNLFPVVGTGPRALWDGGGVDTLSAQGYSGGDVTINLNEGPEYRSGDLTHFGYSPLVIDYGASIENAVGGDGNDTITGNDLNNEMRGWNGDDTLYGGTGADKLYGGAGNDALNGGDGADILYGNAGADTLNGDAGDDVLSGGAGADMLMGGDGADALSGNDGADTLSGDAGDDRLNGDAGADTLSGGDGDDLLNGGAGADNLTGGAGNDSFLISSTTDGLDTIADFVSGTDRIGFDHNYFAGLTAGARVHVAVNKSLPAHVAGFVFSAYRGATSGALSWDPDGVGGASGIKLAVLTGVTTLTAADLYVF